MLEITHLTSQRKNHLKNHFELRGHPEIGYRWWLVFDGIDAPPELVGPERQLPSYALAQLTRLRAEPKIGDRRKARYIDASLHFFPGEEHNGIPHRESVDWLRQYERPMHGGYRDSKGYLVVTTVPHQEDYPLQIWESFPAWWCPELDLLDSEYRLVWKRQEDED